RFALGGTLALLAGLFALDALQAQVGAAPSVWKCPRCLAVLGAGEIKPALASCPFCRVQFAGDVSPQRVDFVAKMPAPPFNNPMLNRPMVDPTSLAAAPSRALVVTLGVVGVVLLLTGAGMVTIALCVSPRR